MIVFFIGILKMKESGVTERLMKEYVREIPKKRKRVDFQSLSWGQLTGCFAVYASTIAGCLLMLLGEFCRSRGWFSLSV